MQPTSSGVNTPPQIERTLLPNRVPNDDSAATIRVDAPDSSSVIKAPHGPVSSVRSGSGRVRGERPKSTAASDGTHGLPQQTIQESSHKSPGSMESSESEFAVRVESGIEEDSISDLNWSVLHAEDISRVLDQRLFEVERKERMLNRRAAQISQQERMFRLWANDTRFELERKRRELQQFESVLIQRSHDLRWLLVHGDQFESGEMSARHESQSRDFDCVRNDAGSQPKHPKANTNPASLEEELRSQIEELEFGSGKDDVRRLNR